MHRSDEGSSLRPVDFQCTTRCSKCSSKTRKNWFTCSWNESTWRNSSTVAPTRSHNSIRRLARSILTICEQPTEDGWGILPGLPFHCMGSQTFDRMWQSTLRKKSRGGVAFWRSVLSDVLAISRSRFQVSPIAWLCRVRKPLTHTCLCHQTV